MPDPAVEDRSDEQLAADAQAGCRSSFETLVRRFQTPLLGFLMQRCGGRADAEDLVQDTFVRAFGALQRFDPGRSFSAWLYTIAHRLALNHRRDRATAPASHDGVDLVAAHCSDAARLVADEESHQRLWATARDVLDEERFTMLWLRVVEDMAHADIAQVLGRSSVSVRVELHRARKQLQQHLTQAADDRPEVRHVQTSFI